MSVKIYDGLKYSYNDLKDVGKFHRKLINIAQEHYSVIYNQKVASFCLDIVLCVLAFHSNDLKAYIENIVSRHFYSYNDEVVSDHIQERLVESIMNILDKEKWDDNDDTESLFSFIQAIATATNFLFVTDTIFKNAFQVRIALYYYDDYVLFIPQDDCDNGSVGRQGGLLHQRLQKITGVEEYHYQNSSDRPEDIPEKDWENRYVEWELATTSFQQSMNFCNCSEILVNHPNQTNIIPMMYTMNKEVDPYYFVTQEFIDMIHKRYETSVKSMFRLKIESRVDISSLDESKGWVRCFKYLSRMTNYLIEINEHRDQEFKEKCDEVFIPLFDYFELK